MSEHTPSLDLDLGDVSRLSRPTRLSTKIRSLLTRVPFLDAGWRRAEMLWSRLAGTFCDAIAPLVERFMPQRRLVAVVNEAGELDLFWVVNRTVERIEERGTAALSQRRSNAIELRLRRDQILERRLSLPVASRDFLGPIIEHRLERLTPWRPEDVLYGFVVEPTASPSGAIAVRFAATSPSLMKAPLAAMRDLGLQPTALGYATQSPADALEIDFYRRTAMPESGPLQRIFTRIWLLGFACLLVVAVTAGAWHANSSAWREDAETHLMAMRKRVRLAADGRIGAPERALIATKTTEASLVVLIDKLAKTIPMDTYLHELAITPASIRLTGVSADATALIGLLDHAGLVDARFTAPVTREKDKSDRFEITAGRNALPRKEAP